MRSNEWMGIQQWRGIPWTQLYTREKQLQKRHTQRTRSYTLQISNGGSTFLLGEDGDTASGPGVLALGEHKIPSHERRHDHAG